VGGTEEGGEIGKIQVNAIIIIETEPISRRSCSGSEEGGGGENRKRGVGSEFGKESLKRRWRKKGGRRFSRTAKEGTPC